MADHEKDLPLMANTKDILVSHYILFLRCDFYRQIFEGEMLITLEPTSSDSNEIGATSAFPFKLVLDSKDINIQKVHEVSVERRVVFTESVPDREAPTGAPPLFVLSMDTANDLRHLPTNQLQFSVEPWCVKIWKEGVNDAMSFPRLISLRFETSATGASIKWTKDQDNRECCYTHGAWINNRSLFPCQEPPIAMATWQAYVTVPADAAVVMSGDDQPHVTLSENQECRTFYYHTLMKLPMATLALAIGYWETESLNRPTTSRSDTLAQIPSEYDYTKDGVRPEEVACRIVSAGSLLSRTVQEFGGYLPKCLKAATNWLGPYPFRRFDLVVMPPCFDCLGLASPNVTFVSQSLLAGDGSMSIHLAHEVAHAWFGLLIGARDWTEEWLSEGFATFMEDVIHQSCSADRSAAEYEDWCQMRSYLRFRTLCSELEYTDADIQKLRPNQGEETADVESGTSIVYVKNGMNEEKMFTQVHYLKGYFLLKYLSDLIGFQPFMILMIGFVRKYHGQLVSSKEVLQLFLDGIPKIEDNIITVERLNEQWLDFPGIPPMLGDNRPLLTNQLYFEVLNQTNFWKTFNQEYLKKKGPKRRKFHHNKLESLNIEQIILLLELLLEEPHLCKVMLRKLNGQYKLCHKNANIRHRWCELIIKHNHKDAMQDVKSFLIQDQAMGVYLYGELMLSEMFLWQKLARDCWNVAKDGLSPSARKLVLEMIQ